MKDRFDKGTAVAAVLGIGGGAVLLWALSRKVGGAPSGCKYLDKVMQFYYFTYTGPAQTFQAALGDCYAVIYTIDVWDEESQDYWPPVDPVHDLIYPGAKCRVKVLAPCTLCKFS